LRRRSVGDVKEYLVERYLPGVTSAQVDEAGARLAAACEELATRGVGVRYRGSTFVLEEESCFCRFDGVSAEEVRLACERAGVAFARIVETRDFSPRRDEEEEK
jgi:Protein of unknown function (DUF4242)